MGSRASAGIHPVLLFFSAVIPGVDAGIVENSVDPDPVSLIDPPSVPGGGAQRIRTRDPEPSPLLAGNDLHILDRLGEILVLAEDQADVINSLKGQADHVECETDIDSLLLTDEKGVGTAIREPYGLVSIS